MASRSELELLRQELSNERSSFDSHWRDIGDYVYPRRVRFEVSDTNKGYKVNTKIINSTALMALRTLRSGMMSGVTSPARPWFKLAHPIPDINKVFEVKRYLDEVSERMRGAFLRSNLYNVLPIIYGDIGSFGSSALFMEQDDEIGFRFYPFPIGSFSLANDGKGRVRVFFREYRMTVNQVVDKFAKKNADGSVADWSNISQHVKNLYERNQRTQWIDIAHVVRANPDYDPNRVSSRFKKFQSINYEYASGGQQNNVTGNMSTEDNQKMLRVSGYDYFPVLCPRWEMSGEDIYGTASPGMISLGDNKALQLMEKRKAQMIEKMVRPPMVGPASLRKQNASILPGDVTFEDSRDGGRGFRAAHEINPAVLQIREDIREHELRIGRAFFQDLFLMLAQSDRRQITAREIDERHEEKLLALGPVLEQLNQDLLDPLIDNAFMIMEEQDLLPEAPELLQGGNLKVEYISIMAQAQKIAGLGALERFASFTYDVANADPRVLDKVNSDELIDAYADQIGIPTSILNPPEKVEAMRQAQAQAQQQQAQVEQANMQAKTAKDLSQAPIEDNTALGELIKLSEAGNVSGAA